MELKLVKKTDKAIELEIKGENDTLLNLLKQKLLEDPNVASATYVIGHPLLDVPKLVVEAKSGKPEQHVKAAAKALREEIDELETQILRGA